MKSTKEIPGQITIFDVVICPEVKTEKLKPAMTLADFDSAYGKAAYIPSSVGEVEELTDMVAELIEEAYSRTGVELVYVDVDCCPIGGSMEDVIDYRVRWKICLPGVVDDTKAVYCYFGRLSPSCENGWRKGDVFTYTASAHTIVYASGGKQVTDKHVFLDNKVSGIIASSLEMLHKLNVVDDVMKQKPKKEKLSPIQKFIRENNGVVIEDCITVTGDDFKSYCRKLRNALNKEAKLVGFDSVSLSPNHYDMSGFFKRGDRYVYWHFDVMRYNMPTYLDKGGFLYRTAKSDKDSTGGANNYTDLANLCTAAYSLI